MAKVWLTPQPHAEFLLAQCTPGYTRDVLTHPKQRRNNDTSAFSSSLTHCWSGRDQTHCTQKAQKVKLNKINKHLRIMANIMPQSNVDHFYDYLKKAFSQKWIHTDGHSKIKHQHCGTDTGHNESFGRGKANDNGRNSERLTRALKWWISTPMRSVLGQVEHCFTTSLEVRECFCALHSLSDINK